MSGEVLRREALIPGEQAGARADIALTAMWPDFSRSRIQRWIKDGQITLDGHVLRPRDPVPAGAKVVLATTLEAVGDDQPEPIGIEVVHEDQHLIVINKPSGLVVHPGAGNRQGTLVNALLNFASELVRLPRAGLVHRLDKDTSGLLVIGRTVAAHTRLVEMMQAREISREYSALVNGVPTGGGTINEPIGRHPTDRTRMAIREQGRSAVTHFTVTERFRAHALLGVNLETGRTHQIRVHLAHRRYPIVGDPVYGRRQVLPSAPSPALVDALRAFRRQALHAARLSFIHPGTGQPVSFDAPLPADFQQLLAVLREDAGA